MTKIKKNTVKNKTKTVETPKNNIAFTENLATNGFEVNENHKSEFHIGEITNNSIKEKINPLCFCWNKYGLEVYYQGEEYDYEDFEDLRKDQFGNLFEEEYENYESS